MIKNYYNILEINKNANKDDIKTSFKKLALKYHPDKNINNNDYNSEKFKDISEAFQILSDNEKKKKYDSILDMNGLNILSESDFNQIFGNFKAPSELFSEVFDIIPEEFKTLSNNIFNYIFEDKKKFDSQLNQFEFDKIFYQVKRKLFTEPIRKLYGIKYDINIFYKLLNIIYMIFHYCSFYFYNKLTNCFDT